MTGEITLRGRVLPVGGSRRRCWPRTGPASARSCCPAENEKDLEELPENVRREMCFRLVFAHGRGAELALLAAEEKAGATADDEPRRPQPAQPKSLGNRQSWGTERRPNSAGNNAPGLAPTGAPSIPLSAGSQSGRSAKVGR